MLVKLISRRENIFSNVGSVSSKRKEERKEERVCTREKWNTFLETLTLKKCQAVFAETTGTSGSSVRVRRGGEGGEGSAPARLRARGQSTCWEHSWEGQQSPSHRLHFALCGNARSMGRTLSICSRKQRVQMA